MFYVFMFKSFIMILYYFYKSNNLENLKTKSVEKSHSVSRTFLITFPESLWMRFVFTYVCNNCLFLPGQ